MLYAISVQFHPQFPFISIHQSSLNLIIDIYSVKSTKSPSIRSLILIQFDHNNNNLYFKRVTPITMKRILPSGPLKTKLITINYNNHDKKPINK